MAVKIRLARFGKKKTPFYRIVVSDSRNARDAKYIEKIGYYDVLKDSIVLDKKNSLKWLKQGAKPTNTVRNILSKQGVMKEFHESKNKNQA